MKWPLEEKIFVRKVYSILMKVYLQLYTSEDLSLTFVLMDPKVMILGRFATWMAKSYSTVYSHAKRCIREIVEVSKPKISCPEAYITRRCERGLYHRFWNTKICLYLCMAFKTLEIKIFFVGGGGWGLLTFFIETQTGHRPPPSSSHKHASDTINHRLHVCSYSGLFFKRNTA
jgi:hypothetical protein